MIFFNRCILIDSEVLSISDGASDSCSIRPIIAGDLFHGKGALFREGGQG